MSIDGISPSQLRQLPEMNSAELDAAIKPNQNLNTRAVDGLSGGQRVDPEKEKKRHNDGQSSENEEESENDTANYDEEENEKFNSYKIDLSQADKYELKLNDKSDTIVIVNKDDQKPVRVIDAKSLAVFVKNLADAKGSIINGKF